MFSESVTGIEAAQDGTYEVTLITPGLGASAYYSEEIIARDAPLAFPKGTHVYVDHLEKGERRTTQKLVGVLTEETSIREADGAAINRIKPFKHWADFVEDVREHVALSISAAGTGKEGMHEGKRVILAESLDYSPTNTVDIVPWGGRAGSGFNESLEAAIQAETDDQPDPSAPGEEEEGNKMELSAEAITALASAISEKVGVALNEALAPKPEEKDENADRLATVEAVQAVESAEVPASVKARLVEGIKDGSLTAEAVKSEIAAAVALREEIEADVKTKFTESLNPLIGAAGAAGGTEAPTVKGWAS